MAITKPSVGAAAGTWGATLNTALDQLDLQTQDADFTPNTYALKAWTMDPAFATSTNVLTSGTVYVSLACLEPGTTSLANVQTYVTTAGAGLTYARIGVYALDGTLLGTSGDLSTSFTTTGYKSIALGAAVTIPSGTRYVYLAVVAVGTTGPTLARQPGTSVSQILTYSITGTPRSGVIASQAALPSPLGTPAGSNLTMLLSAS